MNNIIFDIDGFVSYPRAGKIVQKAQERHRVIFWTVANRETALEELRRYGIPDNTTVIGANDIELFNATHGDRVAIRSILLRRMFPDTEKTMHHIVGHWDSTHHRRRSTIKYPPWLLEGRSLLVQSDGAGVLYTPPGEALRRPRSVEYYQAVSQQKDFALILIPEHPNVWQYQNPDSAAQQIDAVNNRLFQLVSEWNGQHWNKDLGKELGIEGYIPGKERK